MKRLLVTFVLLVVSAAPLFAQSQYRAAAKFVCGPADQSVINAFAFAPGTYYTTLNVTNPNDSSAVNGRKRFSVALLSQKVGPSTGWFAWTLAAGQSMQVDCGDIYSHLGIAPGTFIDGFVHFVGDPVRYEVTGVYTVTDGTHVVSQHVEEVTIR